MQKHVKIKRIIKDKTGASLLFVLGIMLLLMAVGVSLLTAASSNLGLAHMQRDFNRARILDDSIHQNIMFSLQNNPADRDLLSQQLAWALYNAKENAPTNRLESFDLNMTFDEGPLIQNYSIRLSFPVQNVTITPAVPGVFPVPETPPDLDDDENPIPGTGDPGAPGIPREPKTATISAQMIVTVAIEARDRTITSRAWYEYTGGALTDDPDAPNGFGFNNPEPPPPMQFASNGYGTWELMRYEIVN